MIVLVGFRGELQNQLEIVNATAKKVMEEKKTRIDYMVGTMIEIPRGALCADEIAKDAQFFSFGTNDLTQTTLGMSRDDSGSFLPHYQELEIVNATRLKRSTRRASASSCRSPSRRAARRVPISSSASAGSTAASRRRWSSATASASRM